MGSFSILNNISALNAQNQLGVTSSSLHQTINRLSSGKRVNTGADDAAGLMIADTLRANVRALDQGVRNANDSISVLQISDGALQEITNLLTRSVTLAEQAATGTIDSTSRGAVHSEFQLIQAEITRIASTANFNGRNIFTTGANALNGSLSVFVGDIAQSSSISVTISTITVSGNFVQNLGGANLEGVNLTTTGGAATALTTLKSALNNVSTMRATIGAGMNRLQSAISVMQSQSLNTAAAESTIRDANMATEISNLTKFQVLSQTGTAALSQANAQGQSILSLLQGI